MGTTNIILGVGFATLSALIATLIVQVRALRSALAYLGAQQIKNRDAVVFRAIDAIRDALGSIDDPYGGPLPDDEDDEDDGGTPASPSPAKK